MPDAIVAMVAPERWTPQVEIVSAAGVIRGRTVTTVPKCALDAQQSGAKYVDPPTVVDGNLVTARGWQDHASFMHEYVKMLKSRPGV